MNIGDINVKEAIKKIEEAMTRKDVPSDLKAVMEIMLLLIKLLLQRLGINSKNSSKPPSQDPNRTKKKNGQNENQKKRGGQEGRVSDPLKPVDNPDEIIELKIDLSTLPSGEYKSTGYEKRQVFDFSIRTTVTEYRAEVVENENGQKFTAPFPSEAKGFVSYGNRVRSHAVYLSQYQLLPYNRIEEYFKDEMQFPLSAGSINNFLQEAFEKLDWFEHFVKSRLLEERVIHADETGVNINGERKWLHGNTSLNWTYLIPHEKRGKEAMDKMGILSSFSGIVVHDHWKPYFKHSNISHALCNAHHLRELQRAWETEGQEWTQSMIDFLLKTNEEISQNGGLLSKEESDIRRTRYREILKEAEKEFPPPEPSPIVEGKKKKGRAKQTFARNLLNRLRDFEREILLFMDDKDVPFTNNLGERDIRMTKVQQKISGCFRSFDGAKIFCRIRSYLSSAKKHGISPSDALDALFRGENIFTSK